jgi:hypothetical protein
MKLLDLVGLSGRGISPTQCLYLHRTAQYRKRQLNIHSVVGVRTHELIVQAIKAYASDRTATGTGCSETVNRLNVDVNSFTILATLLIYICPDLALNPNASSRHCPRLLTFITDGWLGGRGGVILYTVRILCSLLSSKITLLRSRSVLYCQSVLLNGVREGARLHAPPVLCLVLLLPFKITFLCAVCACVTVERNCAAENGL